MSHTYISDLVHCVFSTKLRRNLIAPQVQPDLWAFLGGIARKNGFKALIAGGTENHAHILLSMPATLPLAKAMQLIKGASSRWMNAKHADGFRVAGGVRRIHHRSFTNARHGRVYPWAERTSSQAEFRGRVLGVFEEERCCV